MVRLLETGYQIVEPTDDGQDQKTPLDAGPADLGDKRMRCRNGFRAFGGRKTGRCQVFGGRTSIGQSKRLAFS